MLDTLANKQALADGVVGSARRPGRDSAPQRPSGVLERLNQLVGEAPVRPAPQAAPARRQLPSDRPARFCRRSGATTRCVVGFVREERFPREGAHSVLYVVVESQAALHRPRLEALHAELCGDLESVTPVRLEVQIAPRTKRWNGSSRPA